MKFFFDAYINCIQISIQVPAVDIFLFYVCNLQNKIVLEAKMHHSD